MNLIHSCIEQFDGRECSHWYMYHYFRKEPLELAANKILVFKVCGSSSDRRLAHTQDSCLSGEMRLMLMRKS